MASVVQLLAVFLAVYFAIYGLGCAVGWLVAYFKTIADLD